jgi:hypothetical protein
MYNVKLKTVGALWLWRLSREGASLERTCDEEKQPEFESTFHF